MNFNEALQVLRRINVHHGNAPISDAQAQCFYEELARSVSFDEANAAVREFYALHPHGEWMTVGDINLAVRRKRRQSMPTARPMPAIAPEFVQLPLAPTSVASRDIRIEIRRGNTAIKVDWPEQASGDCAAWLRDWLR